MNPGFAALIATVMLPACLVSAAEPDGRQLADGPERSADFSAALLYNQGNRFAREGNVGKAVLNYERARLLAPMDQDIAANLKVVREHAGIETPKEGGAVQLATWAAPNVMAWLGSAGLGLAGGGFILGWRWPQRRTMLFLAGGMGGLLMVLSMANAAAVSSRLNAAVVLAKETGARVSPVSAAAERFKLIEGDLVHLRARHGDFVLLENGAGESGWVVAGAVEQVVP